MTPVPSPVPTKPAPAVDIVPRLPCPIRRQQLWALIQRTQGNK